MLEEKVPHDSVGADVVCSAASDPFWQVLSARPGMSPSRDGVEDDVRIPGAVCIGETANVRGDLRPDRISPALISLGNVLLAG